MFPKYIKDQVHRILVLQSVPKRIVSLVPSQTELIVDLGLENKLVGITKFCCHPVHLKKSKKIVGGTKNVNIQKIAELKPDIILCNKEENTKEIVAGCEQIAPTHVSNIFTIKDVQQLIMQYGEIFAKIPDAEKMIATINQKLRIFNQFMISKKNRRVAYFIWKKPWMVAGNHTFIQHLLDANKFENIYKNKNRYPEIELQKLQEDGNPELILLSSEPYPFKEKDISEIQQYHHQAKIIFVDGEMFSWHGSRLLKAFDYFIQLHNRI